MPTVCHSAWNGWAGSLTSKCGAPDAPRGAIVSVGVSYGSLTLGGAFMSILGARDCGGTEITDFQDGEVVPLGIGYARGINEVSLVLLAGRDAGRTLLSGSN